MERNRRIRLIVILALCFSIISISMAYAAFNAMLEIKTQTYLEGNNWLIRFENISDAITSGNAKEVNSPLINSTNISLDVALLAVNDSISYTFDVTNAGNIDAKLSSIPIVTGIAETLKDKIEFKISHADDTELVANELLEKGQTKKFKITLKYLNNDITENYINLNISSIFLYVQS